MPIFEDNLRRFQVYGPERNKMFDINSNNFDKPQDENIGGGWEHAMTPRLLVNKK